MLRSTSALPQSSNPDSFISPSLASDLLFDPFPSLNYVPIALCHNSPPFSGLSGAAGDSLAF